MKYTPQPPGCQGGSLWVWCPQNLDIDCLLKSCRKRVAEGVLWLGHCVYCQLADDARCREAGRVPLRAEYLRNVIGRHHLDAVRQVARQIRYVERDPSYRAGARSQTYWILPPYDRARLVRRQITDPALRHNIRSWREARRRGMWTRIRRSETPVDPAVCEYLWQNLQRVRLDADLDFGDAFQPAYQVAAQHIWHGELWFTVDDYGRIHTDLTNLPKTLRQHLALESERLANVDISESQPLFVALALAEARNGRRGRKAESTKAGKEEANQGPPYHMMDKTMMDSRPYLGGGFDRERLPPDLRSYFELCERRGLYQAVADLLGKTREEAKKAVMVVFFDKPWHRTKVHAVLHGLFPTVTAEIGKMKRPDYRRLAHFAQRVESAFLFGRVVPRLMQLRADLFVSTIHDSVLTTAGDAEFVRQVMRDEFAELGLSPQVKVELCSTSR